MKHQSPYLHARTLHKASARNRIVLLAWRAYYKTTTEELLPSLYDLLRAKIPVEVSTP